MIDFYSEKQPSDIIKKRCIVKNAEIRQTKKFKVVVLEMERLNIELYKEDIKEIKKILKEILAHLRSEAALKRLRGEVAYQSKVK